jgi:hypothetical protein
METRNHPALVDLDRRVAAGELEAIGIRLFDSARFAQDLDAGVGEIRLFSNPINSTVTVANDPATSYRKTGADTNNLFTGTLPQGQTILIKSLQAQVVAASFNATTEVAGEATNPTPAVSDDTTNSASALIMAMINQMDIALEINGKQYERGLLCDFPSKAVVGGFAGGSLDEGIAQNGNGNVYEFPSERLVNGGSPLEVVITNHRVLRITRSLRVRAILEGVLYRTR